MPPGTWPIRHVLTVLALGAASPARAAEPPGPETAGVCAKAGPCATLRARVRAAGTRAALSDVRVTVVPAEGAAWTATIDTDAAGRFALDLPPGKVRVVVAAPGFARLEQVVEVKVGKTSEAQLFVRPTEYNPYRTTVREAGVRRPETIGRTLSREEIATLPGSQGDPLRALQNMPGVARTPGGLGLLVLRGASPNQSGVFVGEHPVPRAFHALALSSVVPADVIARLDFVPGNFDSRYGNASGGLVVLEPRRGRRDGYHGFLEVDLAAASALVEGPIGKKGSFIVAGQRGYIDAALRAVQSLADLNGSVLPTYYDYQAMADFPLKGGASLSARVLGAGDRIRFRFRDYESGGELQDALDFRFNFHRVDLTYRKRLGAWSAMVSPAMRFDTGRQLVPLEDREQYRRDYVFSLRAELSRQVTQRFDVVFGADMIYDHYRARGRIPDGINFPPPEQHTRGDQTWIGAYMSGRLRLGSLLLVPGIRGSGFAFGGERAFALDPRVTALWDIADRWGLRFGVGQYSQARINEYGIDAQIVPTGGRVGTNQVILPAYFANFEPNFSLVPRGGTLRVIKAAQLSAGVSHELTSELSIDATAFYRFQDTANPPTNVFGRPTRESYAQVWGVELLLRRPLTRRLYGWIAYTWMHAATIQPDQIDRAGRRFPGDFDQRHNLALVLSYKLPRGWQIGGRFRLVTGQPFTPVVGSVEADGTFAPIYGTINSARFPPFHQLDLRVDRRWVYKRVSFLAFLDVLNVYNRQNVEMYVYSYDFRDTQGGFGLPIFPTLGLRLDY
jgi:hypothetical protein